MVEPLKKQLSDEENARVEAIKKILKPGDVITHTICLGIIEEHYFHGYDGCWIVGIPTRDTFRFKEYKTNKNRLHKDNLADDIHPTGITHINREPVDAVLSPNFIRRESME